ncbi:MAG: hypothetical protein IPM34_05245 [Saprospiraceae bacterium]|nr:hypothetical protein [Saprospiraceae bacterium]
MPLIYVLHFLLSGKIPWISLCLLLTFINIKSQTMLSGTYALRGVHDMAAAFRFQEDGSFEFRYAYGASDRYAQGTYEISGDTIHLKSNKKAGEDFTVTSQTNDCSHYEIKVNHPDHFFRSYVEAIGFIGQTPIEAKADSEGIIRFEETKLDKVYVHHAIYPDVPTLIKDEQNGNHRFVVELKPSLEAVSFKGIDFFIKEDYITCHPNYFLPINDIRYYKEGE